MPARNAGLSGISPPTPRCPLCRQLLASQLRVSRKYHRAGLFGGLVNEGYLISRPRSPESATRIPTISEASPAAAE